MRLRGQCAVSRWRQPSRPFEDGGGHGAHWLRPHCCRSYDKLRAHWMLRTDVRSVASTVATITTDPAIPVGTSRRRGAHRARSDVSNTLLSCIACRKPSGDIYGERLSAADSSAQRQSTARRAFFFLEKTATNLDTKSDKSRAPNSAATDERGATNSSATAPPARTAAW